MFIFYLCIIFIFTGVILKETKRDYDEDAERTLKVSATFNKFSSWNLDSKPSDRDKIRLVTDWIQLAQTVNRLYRTVASLYKILIMLLLSKIKDQSNYYSLYESLVFSILFMITFN